MSKKRHTLIKKNCFITAQLVGVRPKAAWILHPCSVHYGQHLVPVLYRQEVWAVDSDTIGFLLRGWSVWALSLIKHLAQRKGLINDNHCALLPLLLLTLLKPEKWGHVELGKKAKDNRSGGAILSKSGKLCSEWCVRDTARQHPQHAAHPLMKLPDLLHTAGQGVHCIALRGHSPSTVLKYVYSYCHSFLAKGNES